MYNNIGCFHPIFFKGKGYNVKKNQKGFLAVALSFSMLASLFAPVASDVEAAAKPKLSVKSVSVKVGQTKTVKVKNAKKAKWSIKKSAIAKIKVSGKNGVKLTGKKKGTTTLVCKAKTNKWKTLLSCKVKVTAKPTTTTTTATPAPTQSATEVPGTATTAPGNSTLAPGVSPSSQPVSTFNPNGLESIKDTYSSIFPRMGNVLRYNESWREANQGILMQRSTVMDFFKYHYNSFTLENEMKPDSVFVKEPGWGDVSAVTLTVDEAKKQGYVIPSGYSEKTVPQLNFTNIDGALEVAKQYGIQMRAHVLMWHQQTPTAFFKENYQGSGKVVTPAIMDKRLEFYVRTVMKHVLEKEKELGGSAGSLVYCWDVTNEYTHRDHDANNPSWVQVYGDMKLKPTYVKKAYEFAYDMLKQYKVEKNVTLFYNDYDEYDVADEIVELVKYINEGEEANICGGIGMQSHITTQVPTLSLYETAVDKFLATGLEVQVTELDIGRETKEANDTEEDLAKRYADIMKILITKHKNRDTKVNPKGITCVTVWGLYDTLSWRVNQGYPSCLLLGKSLKDEKKAFYSFIEAAK